MTPHQALARFCRNLCLFGAGGLAFAVLLLWWLA